MSDIISRYPSEGWGYSTTNGCQVWTNQSTAPLSGTMTNGMRSVHFQVDPGNFFQYCGEARHPPAPAHPAQAEADPVPVGGPRLVPPGWHPHPRPWDQQPGASLDTCPGHGPLRRPGARALWRAPRRRPPRSLALAGSAVGSSRMSAVERSRPYHTVRHSSNFERTVSNKSTDISVSHGSILHIISAVVYDRDF